VPLLQPTRRNSACDARGRSMAGWSDFSEGQLLKAQFTSVQLTLNCRRKAKGRPRPDGLSSNLHPPTTTTKASIVNDARTSIVSKEASFMMTSASTPRGTVVDSII
jgi:hypothetical protein